MTGPRIGAPVRNQGPPVVGTLSDMTRPGRRAWSFPDLDVPAVELPPGHRRADRAALPEVAERDLVAHFTRLS